ncbi:M20/M25/M40 family metallo-hydrolase [Phenylobacterium sp.]|uniref:M20/M25/M40 family metallo-hydrolase n=1 Tax=Phenylobacterium sp. TaxID=1871053 RepID=UPI002735E1BB|nr:M20/M25/M40 family metallo-hydrolase [Phenylobacterium sp.]MDP3854417.1 M20/M25/M40 family metallo-hydrolase [Phenylobacterium sp.]
MTYGKLLGAGLCAAALLGASARAQTPPAANLTLAREILGELIAINTVHDQGTLPAAEAIQKRMLAAGFASTDVTVLTIPGHPTQGQVLVRLRAKAAKAKPVLWISHLDVVEAKREDWTVEPFALTEKDGWLYGRGVQDMKGEIAALLAGLIRAKREGFIPARDMIFAFTSDEESGDANGVEWLLKAQRPLVDAALVINSDGGGGSLRGDQRLSYGVQTSEKVYVTFQLEATNKGGHSSIPEPDNAIYRLAKGLARIEGFKFPVVTTPTTRGYFATAAALESGQATADMLAVSKQPTDLAAAERLSATPARNARLRTTCVATGLSGGHAENALPQRARAVIQCRMMPTDSEAEVRAKLVEVLADQRIAVSVISPAAPARDSPYDAALMARFTKVVQGMWPSVPVAPHMDLGATDSLYTRAVGMPSYAVGAIWGDIDDNRAHGRDERISTKAFSEAVEFDYRLIKSVAAAR